MRFPAVRWERVKDYLLEDTAMVSLLMEAVVISFALGGVVGAVVAIQLLHPEKATAEQAGGEVLEP